MDSKINAQSNLNKLLQIQLSRLKGSEIILKQKQQEYKQACTVLNERKDNINSINKRIHSVYEYSSLASVFTIPDKINRCNTYLFWLNYDLEMHEYYQSQEEERVEETKKQYMLAKHNWYKQKQKTEKINELYNKNINTRLALIEELEDESYIEIRLQASVSHYG